MSGHLTVRETMARFAICRATLHNWRKLPGFPKAIKHKLTGTVRFREADLAKWERENQ